VAEPTDVKQKEARATAHAAVIHAPNPQHPTQPPTAATRTPWPEPVLGLLSPCARIPTLGAGRSWGENWGGGVGARVRVCLCVCGGGHFSSCPPACGSLLSCHPRAQACCHRSLLVHHWSSRHESRCRVLHTTTIPCLHPTTH